MFDNICLKFGLQGERLDEELAVAAAERGRHFFIVELAFYVQVLGSMVGQPVRFRPSALSLSSTASAISMAVPLSRS